MKGGNIIFCTAEKRLQNFKDGSVGTEKIKERHGEHQQQAKEKAAGNDGDLDIIDQHFVVQVTIGFYQVIKQKCEGNHAVVDAVF